MSYRERNLPGMSASHRILAAVAAATLLATAAPAAAAPTPPGAGALPGAGAPPGPGTLPGPGASPGAGEGAGRPGSAGLPLPTGSAGAPGSAGSPGPVSPPDPDPFYDEIPASLGAPGTVLKTAPGRHLLAMTGVDWPGAATKIMYTSTRQTGERTGVTGVVIEPTAEWTGPGPRPTVVVAPGTQGVGDRCAPSRGTGYFAAVDPGAPSLALNYELHKMYGYAAKGIRVVLTDYIGLGTPGMHSYGNATDQAHAVLDAARAALALAGADPGDPVGITGYSQGGGSAAAAAERAAAYAPELNVVTTYAGAMPTDIRSLLSYLDGTGLVGALGYGMHGFGVYAPELRGRIRDRLNEEGRRFLDATAEQCTVDVLAAWGGRDTGDFTADGRSFEQLVESLPELAAIIDAQHLGRAIPNRPMILEGSPADDAIPYEGVRQLGRTYCAAGVPVTFHRDDTPPLIPGSSLNHVASMERTIPVEVRLLDAAFRGEELPDDCGDF